MTAVYLVIILSTALIMVCGAAMVVYIVFDLAKQSFREAAMRRRIQKKMFETENRNMTNYEYLMGLPIEKFSEYLVSCDVINEGDEDYDGNLIDNYVDYFVSPDGEQYIEFSEAVDATVRWLTSRHKVDDATDDEVDPIV